MCPIPLFQTKEPTESLYIVGCIRVRGTRAEEEEEGQEEGEEKGVQVLVNNLSFKVL